MRNKCPESLDLLIQEDAYNQIILYAGNFGIIHAHARCFEIEMENDRRVLLHHNYFNETDGKDIILEKLSKLMSAVKADDCTYVLDGCNRASCHKTAPYMNFLLCPDKARDAFYPSGNLIQNQIHNADFKNMMESSLERYEL